MRRGRQEREDCALIEPQIRLRSNVSVGTVTLVGRVFEQHTAEDADLFCRIGIAAGTQIVVPARSGYSLFVATIVLTVSGETDINFGFGVFGLSGSMNFGGTNEPRGIVIAMGDSPAPCGQGAFSISSGAPSAAVGGFVTYYLEPA